jgi:hypothetical protein
VALPHLTAVRTFVTSIEAEIAKSALEAAGIQSVIERDDCGGVRPSMWLGGVALLVLNEDVTVAREVLFAPTFVDATRL